MLVFRFRRCNTTSHSRGNDNHKHDDDDNDAFSRAIEGGFGFGKDGRYVFCSFYWTAATSFEIGFRGWRGRLFYQKIGVVPTLQLGFGGDWCRC